MAGEIQPALTPERLDEIEAEIEGAEESGSQWDPIDHLAVPCRELLEEVRRLYALLRPKEQDDAD